MLPVPNLFPTLVCWCFSPPPFLRNLVDIPGAQMAELSTRDPEVQRSSLQEHFPLPPPTIGPPPPAPYLTELGEATW